MLLREKQENPQKNLKKFIEVIEISSDERLVANLYNAILSIDW